MVSTCTKINNKILQYTIHNKWKCRAFKLSTAVLILFCIDQYRYRNWQFIEISDDKLVSKVRIIIPSEIVKSKNCDQFYRWQYDILGQDVDYPCPWK